MRQWLLSFDHVAERVTADYNSAAELARAVVLGLGPSESAHVSAYWSLSSPLRRVALVSDEIVDVWHESDGLPDAPASQTVIPASQTVTPASQTVIPSARARDE